MTFTIIIFFTNFLISKKSEENIPNNIIDFSSSLSGGIYFNFCSTKMAEKNEIDLKNFHKRKEDLDSYIKEVDKGGKKKKK